MKEFVVLLAHDTSRPVGTLRIADDVAATLASYFGENKPIRLGGGYAKSDDGTIEIKEVSLLMSRHGQAE